MHPYTVLTHKALCFVTQHARHCPPFWAWEVLEVLGLLALVAANEPADQPADDGAQPDS